MELVKKVYIFVLKNIPIVLRIAVPYLIPLIIASFGIFDLDCLNEEHIQELEKKIPESGDKPDLSVDDGPNLEINWENIRHVLGTILFIGGCVSLYFYVFPDAYGAAAPPESPPSSDA